MKKVIILPIVLLLILSLQATNKKEIGTINFRMGAISIKNISLKKWQIVDDGDKLAVGDTIKSGEESKCEVKLLDGSIFKLDQNSLCVFEGFEQKKGSVKCLITQLKGQSWTGVNKKDGKRDFKIKSPVAVAAVIGTVFKFGYDGESTQVSVAEGKVDVDLEKEKKSELNIKPNQGDNQVKETFGPKEIPGPFEVTLSEWISIVRGDVITIRKDGKYNKSKTDPEILDQEWNNFSK